MKKIIMTGGGTAGHVTPNIALMPALKEAGYDIEYIGSVNGMEKDLIQATGNIPERDMYNTFNMGTGLVIAVDADKADRAVRILNAAGEQAAVIGEVKAGEKGVELC